MSPPIWPNKPTYTHDSNLCPPLKEMAVAMATSGRQARWTEKGAKELKNHFGLMTAGTPLPTPKMFIS